MAELNSLGCAILLIRVRPKTAQNVTNATWKWRSFGQLALYIDMNILKVDTVDFEDRYAPERA